MGRIGRKMRERRFRAWLLAGKKAPQKSLVFDSMDRPDTSPKKNVESDFSFLNRSGSVASQRVRDILQKCLDNYPDAEAPEMISRLQSGDDRHFRSASFELLLHEMLRLEGYTLEPHPILPNGSGFRPDFLVTTPEGTQFYLEAVCASEDHQLDHRTEAMKKLLIDQMNGRPHQNFGIAVTFDGRAKTQPSGKKIIREIHSWLDTLNHEEVRDLTENSGLDAAPVKLIAHQELAIQVTAIPLAEGRDEDNPGRFILMQEYGGGAVDAWTPIKEAVKTKGRKYGELEHPLIVAVNLDSSFLDRIDEVQALFGQEAFVFPHPDSVHGSEPQLVRRPNGAWTCPEGYKHTLVSGAWLFNNLMPHSIPRSKGTLYHHPTPDREAPRCLNTFTHAKARDGVLNWSDGKPLAVVFDLPQDWPENSDG